MRMLNLLCVYTMMCILSKYVKKVARLLELPFVHLSFLFLIQFQQPITKLALVIAVLFCACMNSQYQTVSLHCELTWEQGYMYTSRVLLCVQKLREQIVCLKRLIAAVF